MRARGCSFCVAREGYAPPAHPTVPLATVHKRRLQWLDATDDMLAESRAFLFDHGYERDLNNYAPQIWLRHADIEAEKARLEAHIARCRDEEYEILLKIANLDRKERSYLKSATLERLRMEAMGRRVRRRMVNRSRPMGVRPR